ncbi:hypothetical protein INT48_002215 [Thamnidium elegans]|uniref:Transcription factor domain-containing protein n=1 Tax=Thamnidium elegans TaxID=101142 RepID=A0A8H7SWY5_9FUNG|nr:hypothetical protein INT48_002215 [Thamnidium elegans]
MPFDTVERSTKRIRADMSSTNDEDDWYMHDTTSTFEIYNHSNKNNSANNSPISQLLPQDWNNKSYSSYDLNNSYYPYQSSVLSSPPMDYVLPVTPATVPIDIPYSTSSEYLETSSLDDHISPKSNTFWQDEQTESTQLPPICSPTTKSLLAESIHPSLLTDNPVLTNMLSKIQFSYSDIGINLEAKVSNASDLRTLIDTFSQLCSSSQSSSLAENSTVTQVPPKRPVDKMLLYRNKSNNTKPVNFFASTNRLGQLSNPHSSYDSTKSLRLIADACIDTFFTCWVRFKPIIRRDEFMVWYNAHPSPTDTLIVNAICSYAFRHTVIHHPRAGYDYFLKDQDKLQEQEEYFFSQARECLAQSFDTPDRYTIAALLFMSIRAEPSKRHHYAGMAASALHELDIYPRMANENVDCYDKEMDTRLWWFVWAVDFSLWTSGAPKNTPQPRYPGKVDLPQVFEQDIDEAEIGVITFIHCLSLWRIQGDIVAALYECENAELTVEQLTEYDRRLLDFHKALPQYLVFDSGFEYGCEDLFLSCLRVNIEYNATRIILHKLFIPEMNDARPSQTSLDSLNICLSTSLTQLSAIKTCNMADVGRCAFDRDELWRAAEVISVAMDIYHTCVSPADQAKILDGINMEDFTNGLRKSYQILQNTREFRFSCKNWFQVADWIQVEIRRHHLGSSYPTPDQSNQDNSKKNQPDFFLAHLKPHAILNTETLVEQNNILPETKPPVPVQAPATVVAACAKLKQPRKSISFQNQFSVQPTASHTTTFVQDSTNDRRPSFSTAPPFVQFNAYVPPDQQPISGKSQARSSNELPISLGGYSEYEDWPLDSEDLIACLPEDARLSYERAKIFQDRHPPDSVPTDISGPQLTSIQENGVSAFEFEGEPDANVYVAGRTELQFMHGECSIQTNLPLPRQQDVYYWEAKMFEKPESTTVSIGVATKPYPTWRLPGLRWNLFPTIGANGPCQIHVNLGQSGFVFVEANVKKWGLAPPQGTLAPPPPYGIERDTILLATAARLSSSPSSHNENDSYSLHSQILINIDDEPTPSIPDPPPYSSQFDRTNLLD